VTSGERTSEPARIERLLHSAREDRKLAQDAREDATLQQYLTRMSDLMLHSKLLRSQPGSEVRAVARTLTLATLRRLSGERKGEVVRFLSEAQLLNPSGHEINDIEPATVDLADADLRGVVLARAALRDSSLEGADLRGANFTGARLSHMDFLDTDLKGASFRNAVLLKDHFDDARLDGAVFDGAITASPVLPPNDGRRSEARVYIALASWALAWATRISARPKAEASTSPTQSTSPTRSSRARSSPT
jgi:uncharacterized protein YjbI with pentapeptide repeats